VETIELSGSTDVNSIGSEGLINQNSTGCDVSWFSSGEPVRLLLLLCFVRASFVPWRQPEQQIWWMPRFRTCVERHARQVGNVAVNFFLLFYSKRGWVLRA
jgi:hypothetical protein